MDPLPVSFTRKPFLLLTGLFQTSAPSWSVGVLLPSLNGYDFKDKLKRARKQFNAPLWNTLAMKQNRNETYNGMCKSSKDEAQCNSILKMCWTSYIKALTKRLCSLSISQSSPERWLRDENNILPPLLWQLSYQPADQCRELNFPTLLNLSEVLTSLRFGSTWPTIAF